MKALFVDVAQEEDGTYTIKATGKGFDETALGNFLKHLESLPDKDVVLDLPIVRAFEDPEFLAELDRRVKDVEEGTAKTLPWSEVRKRVKERLK